MKNLWSFGFVLLVPVLGLFSQEFGFGEAENPGPPGFQMALSIGGEVSAQLKAFTGDLGSSRIGEIQPGDIFSGKLNFFASGSSAEGVINLKLTPETGGASPVAMDEAYGRFYAGSVTIEGGLRKLTWGRADSFGPLDVINPLDYSDLSAMGEPRNIKIPRPMLHVSWNMGSFARVEGVFVPWFRGHGYAHGGPWAPREITELPVTVQSHIAGYVANLAGLGLFPPSGIPILQTELEKWKGRYNPADLFPRTDTLRYAQGGLRFTTSVGSSDLGIQYYFGRLPRPAVTVDLDDFLASLPGGGTSNPQTIGVNIDYNCFHQIGVDYAQVLGGFNVRAEAGANITGDLQGDDGRVYNPALVWSLGFDRDLFRGINLNLQGNGSVRLMQNKTGDNALADTEAGKDPSSTRITAVLSRKFFRDELELKTTALWGIEDRDFYIIPALVWSKNDVTLELSAGFFGGDREGELGQYRDNHYVKTVLSYRF
ncbi:MAG: hypothetical protein LBD31_09545 [Treponema sp.]|jgi:hypothetical protein|nr:hypothetical protein [Treponema sp.]